MGTWGHGPFDNDAAADWIVEFDGTSPQERPELVRRTLGALVGEPGYIDVDEGAPAIAAATVVALGRPGGAGFGSAHAPGFAASRFGLDLPPECAPLALRALDRVTGGDSEWAELWWESDEGDVAFAMVEDLREVLGAGRPGRAPGPPGPRSAPVPAPSAGSIGASEEDQR